MRDPHARVGEFLRLRRHAFANELQLLYGYLALDDREGLRRQVEKLVHRIEQEKRLQDSLGDRMFFLLLEWESRLLGIRVHYELGGEDLRSAWSPKRVAFFRKWLRVLERAIAAWETEGDLEVSFRVSASRPRTLTVVFRLRGTADEVGHRAREILEAEGKSLLKSHPGRPQRVVVTHTTSGGCAFRFVWGTRERSKR
ncbi:Spo0B domain-containing protein [Brockia lithotrophica]|uniref:Sensor kinase SpoOB-type protein n=1 Tax=Brockia lithotrophica TaxID=933949 RepID=A0A660LAU1_9BACL|nr:Spo0B domain-containing protein [Brockia lithotrophica]RKQ89083.1 sensor kinase SpoOB-type protein [Brockia lithotrophica]